MKLAWMGRMRSRIKGMTTFTKAVMVLLLISAAVFVVSDASRHKGTYYGEVWGDLEASGRIWKVERYDVYHISHSDVGPNGGSSGRTSIIITGAAQLVLTDANGPNGTSVNTTFDVGSRPVEASIAEGYLETVLRDVQLEVDYSEFRGDADDSEGAFSDPYYEVHTTISSTMAEGTYDPAQGMELTGATITVDGREIHLREGSMNLTGEGPVVVRVTVAGRMYGSGYHHTNADEWPVHIDGRLEIDDFREVSRSGGGGSNHEHLVIEGDNITVTDHGGPEYFEHWGVSLEPWTLEITTEDVDGVTSTNWTTPIVLVAIVWGFGTVLMLAGTRPPRATT